MKLLKLITLTTALILLTACSDRGSNGGSNNHSINVNDNNTSNSNGGGSGRGNDNNSSSGNSDQNTTNPIIALALTINQTTLNRDTNTTLKVEATYKDKTTKDITNQAQWLITPKDAVKIIDHTLTALNDTNVTIQAKVGNTVSNRVKLNIYWEVDGHRLPPEPDPKVNNSTLLGIDSNNNGVRDDVERWIYKTYNHPIERGIFMQSARAYQKVIVDPSKAHETTKYMDNQLACEFYWRYDAKENNESFQLDKYEARKTAKKMKKLQFNTLKRHMAYERYNAEFSGEVFGAPKPSKEKCEFDKNGVLGELK